MSGISGVGEHDCKSFFLDGTMREQAPGLSKMKPQPSTGCVSALEGKPAFVMSISQFMGTAIQNKPSSICARTVEPEFSLPHHRQGETPFPNDPMLYPFHQLERIAHPRQDDPR